MSIDNAPSETLNLSYTKVTKTNSRFLIICMTAFARRRGTSILMIYAFELAKSSPQATRMF